MGKPVKMSSTHLSPLPAALGSEPTFSPPIPMASPKLPDPSDVLPRWRASLESGQLTKGPELAAFESECAAALEVSHAVGVSSCTSGLILSLDALARRLPEHRDGSRPRVAVPSFTFMASVAAIVRAGFDPLFIEVDPKTMNLDYEDLCRQLEAHRPVAVLGVHCFGNPLPESELTEICDRFDSRLIIDAAHAFGSRNRGRPLGSAGWCQVFSLTPTKMVVAGEGGVVATDDPELAEELRIGREYGNDGHYDSAMAGLNARLSEFHAALGRCSLEMLEEVIEQRNRTAGAFLAELATVPGLSFQQISPEARTTYKDLTVRFEPEEFGCSRDAIAWALLQEGIPTRAYFSPPCHLHTAYRRFAQRGLPQTEALSERCLSLPLLEEATVEPIVGALLRLRAHAKAIQSRFQETSEARRC